MADCDPADCAPSHRELALLFAGDRNSLRYYHRGLVRELCRRLKPARIESLYQRGLSDCARS